MCVLLFDFPCLSAANCPPLEAPRDVDSQYATTCNPGSGTVVGQGCNWPCGNGTSGKAEAQCLKNGTYVWKFCLRPKGR
jgi:hypothetical protein